jgi:hypothetical protein
MKKARFLKRGRAFSFIGEVICLTPSARSFIISRDWALKTIANGSIYNICSRYDKMIPRKVRIV